MTTSLHSYLRTLIESASEELPAVSWRRMFGCDAAFAGGAIYALVWKTGRIGLKLPEPTLFKKVMAQSGAEPWAPGGKAMSHWVLIPESWHDDEEELLAWVRRAHGLALAAGPPPEKKPAASKRTRSTGAAAKP